MRPGVRKGSDTMDLTKLALFQMAQTRMDWATQRQKILAQNVANADTPKYRAHDLKKLDFGKLAVSENNRTRLVRTDASHQASVAPDPGTFRMVEERYPFESSADGNEVVLEEQMSRLSETKNQYTLATELVKKHLSMIKMVTRGAR
ncbi:Flagellar basal-body rod protein FlgB [Pararhodospirillum photometricum DSM 122]|uniref:Flagellar basal body rod protein FlgB n=2 Tax=Pararhodospirillum photometricum TaxID=1084 RepID=H6SJ46_PARPM|nr:Flagellar basal-body rod protein FlgB [Pararhodospirillum photometricum DSM 122]